LLVEKVTNLFFDEVDELFVVNHVYLVEEHDNLRNTNLLCEENVFTRLWHDTFACPASLLGAFTLRSCARSADRRANTSHSIDSAWLRRKGLCGRSVAYCEAIPTMRPCPFPSVRPTPEPREGEPEWHPLAYHCLDVAAVADHLLARSPRKLAGIARLLGTSPGVARHFLVALIALHDVGKFSADFQGKSEKAWPENVLGAWRDPRGRGRHDDIASAMRDGLALGSEQVMAPIVAACRS
jgi:hypothetical protein